MDSEIIKFLQSKEVKAFGALVGIALVAAGISMVFRNILTNKVLYQQSQINKYILDGYRQKKTPAEQKKIETSETIQQFS